MIVNREDILGYWIDFKLSTGIDDTHEISITEKSLVCIECYESMKNKDDNPKYYLKQDVKLGDLAICDKCGKTIVDGKAETNKISGKTMKTKEELLKHYATRDPVEFIQFDVFTGNKPFESDGLVYADEDGDNTWSGKTTELMAGSTVRVLIEPETKKEIVLRALNKISEWIERDPDMLTKKRYTESFAKEYNLIQEMKEKYSKEIVIRSNNSSFKESCSICNEPTSQDIPVDLFLNGTYDPVCRECGSKYAPGLVLLLDAASSVPLHRKMRYQTENQSNEARKVKKIDDGLPF